MSEKAKVGLELMTAMQTIERRDAHISRLTAELRASRKVVEWVRYRAPHTMDCALRTSSGVHGLRPCDCGLDASLHELDAVLEPQQAALQRLQGKRGGLPGRASGN